MVPENPDEINKIIQNANDITKTYTPASAPIEYIDVKFQENEFQDDSLNTQLKCSDLPYPFAATPVITAPIKDAKILYDNPIGSKKFIELSIDFGDIINYQFNPGDAIGILISNSRTDVDRVLMRLSSCESPDAICDISVKTDTTKKNPKVPPHVPKQASLRSILRDCLDLRSVPKKLFIRSLAEYTTDEAEKSVLMILSSKEGTKIYNETILDKTRTFLDLLDLFPSCCPPLSLLIEHLPRLKPRPYSIANSYLNCPGKIKLILSVLTNNPGVATSFLSEKVDSLLDNPQNPQKVSFYFRETNKFRFHHNEDCILVGIGCGVSPYLGFLEEKDYLMKENNVELGSTWLFVGSTCQESALHRDELLDHQIRGVLQHLYESFSRDAECTDFKHVQDQLRANARELAQNLTKKGTYLYVCADGTIISKSIENCIRECLAEALECSDEEAGIIIQEMRLAGRYLEDIWV